MSIKPDPREVPELMMRQMASFRLTDKKYNTEESVSLVASSNIYGLLFVGIPEKLLAIKVADISELNASSSSTKRSLIELDNLPHKESFLPSCPTVVSLSSDQLTLLVCVTKSGCPFGWLYDVRGCARQSGGWNPFQEVRLSSSDGVTVQDCAWNPTMPNLVAICLSDGSLVMVDLKDSQVEINALPSNTGAQAISWSPKGKQLVVAQPGKLVQYKPDLKEAKTIPFSGSDVEMSQPKVCGLQWISTVQFLVVFVDKDDGQPHLFMINLHKSGAPTFYNYYDICYSNQSSERPHRYLTTIIPSWNIIFACASNAVEVGVMGMSGASESSENQEWRQWLLEDSSRAELPLGGYDVEPKPLGMAIDTSSQTSIPWLENEILPPMPILFVLSTSGVLYPFHVINLVNGLPTQLNQPPQILSSSNERPALANLRPPTTSAVPLAASTPLPAGGKTAIPRTNLGDRFAAAAATTSTTSTDTFGRDMKIAPAAASTETSFFGKSQAIGIQPSPSLATSAAVSSASATTFSSFRQPEAKSNLTAYAPNIQTAVGTKFTPDEPNMGAAAAILQDELTKFAQDLKEFKLRSASMKISVTSEEEKQRLIKMTAELSDFSKELVETTKNQDEEVRSLYTEVVEISALLEEARVRYARRKNPRYSNLLKLRPLDPSNRRKLDSIERIHIHIEQQLEEASRILESIGRDKNKDRQRKIEIPITRVIYEALSSNAKVIAQLKTRLERVKVQINDQQMKLAGAALDILRPQSKNSCDSNQWDSDLSVLADSLLVTKIKNDTEKSGSSLQPVVPQVSPEKQAMLRHVLTHRPVARIRAVRPETASESRLLSNLNSLLHNSSQANDKKSHSVETSSASHPIRSKSSLLLSNMVTTTAVQPTKIETSARSDTAIENSVPKMIPALPVSSFAPVAKTSSVLSNSTRNLPSKVEDITPPSSPLNFEQKAKAIGSQPMMSSLSLTPLTTSSAGSLKTGDNKPNYSLSGSGSPLAFGSLGLSKPAAATTLPVAGSTFASKNSIASTLPSVTPTTAGSFEASAKIKSIFSSGSTTASSSSPMISTPSSTPLFGLASQPPPYTPGSTASSTAATNSGLGMTASSDKNLLVTTNLPKTSFSFMSASSPSSVVSPPASISSPMTKLDKESVVSITLSSLPSVTIPSSAFSFALPQSSSTVSEQPKVGASGLQPNFSFNLNNTTTNTPNKTVAPFSFSLATISANSATPSGTVVPTTSSLSANAESAAPLFSALKVTPAFGAATTPTALTTTSSSVVPAAFGLGSTTPSGTSAVSPFAQVPSNTSISKNGSNLASLLSQNKLPVSGLGSDVSSTALEQQPLFGNAKPVSTGIPPASAPSPLFGGQSTLTGTPTSSSFAPVFGQASFGSTASSGQSPQTVPSSTPLFGQATFGAASSNASPSTGGSSLAAPLFGSSAFGRPTGTISGFMTGNSTFGQSASVSPALAQPLFGGSAFSQAPVSGSAGTSSLGLSNNAFGSMGLGGMSSAAATTPNRNVFGSGAVFGNQSAPATSFGSPPAFGNPGTALAASGFSSPSTPGFGLQSPGQAGGQPAFGGAATFGGSPLFGGKPAFGSPVANATNLSKPEATGFGAFAAASNAPSFGVLANSGPTFEALAGSGTNQPAFGGVAFPQNNAPPSFGGGSSFSSWR